MLSKIKSVVSKKIRNIPGKKVNRKYLVIESDDWGSIRMPSIESYRNLKSHNINLGEGESLRYNISDTLANVDDFSALYETLSKFRDINGNTPVFTALSLVANPDFDKIAKDNFTKYYYEPFTETLKKYNIGNAIEMWREGIDNKLFYPEFHGREHLNISVWMRALQNNDRDTMIAFQEGCWGFMNHIQHQHNIMYQAAFELEHYSDIENHKDAIKTGLELFEEIHGYKAKFFVPPNGPFNNTLEATASQSGIAYMGASKVQLESLGQGKTKKVYHWLGQKNKNGQTYLTRNAFFEPNAPGYDWVDTCLEDISDAFKWNKPVVISSHRTNYIGSLDASNRDNSLAKLSELISIVLKKWPDVEFITSTQLGNIINSKEKDINY